MSGNRRNLRRAQAWRWEPPGVEAAVADEHAQQRWATARTKAITWAAAVAQDSHAVYLDTETTGFGPRAEIVDIAIVDAAGQILLETLVRPTRRIPAEVIAIHGITNANVKDAPEWCDIYETLVEVLTGRRVVVYNVTFDRQMVNQSCERYALTAPAADWECAMKRYAGFYGNWDPGKRWYRFQKLERAVLAFGAEPGGHRAAADAFACRNVVLGMAATALPAPHDLPDAPVFDSGRSWHTPANVPDASPIEAEGTDHAGAAALGRDEPDVRIRWAAAAERFSSLVAGMPTPLRERPGACGGWSVREVVAHCAAWEWEGARRLRLIAADPTLPDAFYDVDRFNAASVAARARQDWARTLDELAKASTTLGRAAATKPEDVRTQEWLLGRAVDFEEHVEGLRRWLAAVGTDASHLVAGLPPGSA
ncbi:MAG: maleylpyruvate isomerase N-terminal domain-containing protein [Chloroflexia bacterium]|nr:maleylpyruvate isomerase N-terminal domain-containing protein [Chloroflexia bacterium]